MAERAQVEVEMSSEDMRLWQSFQKIAKEAAKSETAIKDTGKATAGVTREQERLTRTAKRLTLEMMSPQEKYNARLRELHTLMQKTGMSQETYNRALRAARAEMTGIDQSSGKALGTVRSLATAFGPGIGVAGSIMLASRSFETWRQNLQEISTEAKQAAAEIIAFAALQEGGEKAQAVIEAEQLAARYGIDDRAQSFNTVQALQSAYGGDRQKGMESAATVFGASQLGIPVESGRELEVLGASQGQSPGEAIRRAYVAGQASSRDPATISKAASGISFWDDPEVGFAAAGVLSAGVKEDELQTYLTRGGIGLSTVGNLEEWIKEQGLQQASQLERLKRLAQQGIDTPEELAEIGVDEVREQKSLAILVRNAADVERILGEIQGKAKPGLLAGQRQAVESELPTVELARQAQVMESEFKAEQAFGPSATPALQEELEERARGLLYQKAGYTELFGKDLIDQEGRTSEWSAWLASNYWQGMWPSSTPTPTQLEGLIPQILEHYKSRPGEEMLSLDDFELPTRQDLIRGRRSIFDEPTAPPEDLIPPTTETPSPPRARLAPQPTHLEAGDLLEEASRAPARPAPTGPSEWKTSFAKARRSAEAPAEKDRLEPQPGPQPDIPQKAIVEEPKRVELVTPVPDEPPAPVVIEPPTSPVPIAAGTAPGAPPMFDFGLATPPAPSAATPTRVAPGVTVEQGERQIDLLQQLVTNTAQQTQDTALGTQSTAPAVSEDR